jgi:superfamily II DNA/RNA helicase
VRPEKHEGECVCGRAPGSGHHDLGHHDWCPASVERVQGTPIGSADGIFRAYVDNDGKLEWMISSNLAKGARVGASAIVLGQYVGVDDKGEKKVTLSLRRGQDVRGLVVHDSTDCQRGRNLIGRALHTYTFGEAFAAEPRILARPAVATYVIDPLAIPLAANDLSLNAVNACLGYEVEREWDAQAQRMVPTGVKVKSASKIFFEVLFNDLQVSGTAAPKVVVTMKEYAAMILVIRLLEQGQVRKPIVFCPSAASCRRSMALLRLLLRRHWRSHPLLANVGSGHVFQSATNYVMDADGNQQGEQEAMPLHVRHHLLGEFQSSESYVLFNTNLLSTGVDLPCCDGVVLVSPSTKRRTVLQRWGRSLRVEAHREDKEGTLALVAEDPLEPTELVEARAHALGIEDLEVLKDGNQLDAEKFRAVLRTAETAASSSYKVLGDVFDIVAQFRRQARPPTAAASTKMVVFSWNSPSTGDTFLLDAGMERAFRMLFQARTRTLMLPKGLERFEAYRDFGVRDWVRKTLRRMTDNRAVAKLRGIGQTDTYTPEDGSGELNMGQDMNSWKKSRGMKTRLTPESRNGRG